MAELMFIGFGEAGQAFAGGWREAGSDAPLAAYDIKEHDARACPAYHAACAAHGVTPVPLTREALAPVRMVFSVVTADQSVAAARSVAPLLPEGALFLDLNSVAPQTKHAAQAAFAGSGAHYIDGAILSPVLPRRHRVPLILACPQAGAVAARLAPLFPEARAVSERPGDAAAFKLCRSIVIKGIEALLAECADAIAANGLHPDDIFPTLAASYPGIDWQAQSDYAAERLANHGVRRAAEMEEAALMLRELGIDDTMSAATARSIAGRVRRSG